MAELIEVTDLAQPGLEAYARLTEAQLRNKLEPEKGIFIAESPKVIRRALEAGCVPVSLLMERRHLAGQGGEVMALCGDVPVYTADREVLARLTGYQLTRGILCAMLRPPQPTVEELCAGARRVAVLEGITDTTNLGAIFRSAAALGMDGVLLTPTCCDPLYRRAVRVSMGTEGAGLAPATIEGADLAVRIPMAHGVDSLNVAAASAVSFWQLCPHVSNRYHYQPGIYS